MANSSKRKTWKNIISTSSEESFSPSNKKLKCGKRSDLEGSQPVNLRDYKNLQHGRKHYAEIRNGL